MRRHAVVAVAVVLAVTGCTSVETADTPVRPPGDSQVTVDTPDLQAAKAAAGIEDCVPGAATGALPAVTLSCLGGGPDVDLSTLTGPMVINFWQAACGPCRREMPILGDFHRQYGDQVPVLGVDLLDTVPGLAIELAGEREATYPQLADPGGELLAQETFVRARGLPQLFFVDAGGVVRSQKSGGVDSLEQLVGLVDDALDLDLESDTG